MLSEDASLETWHRLPRLLGPALGRHIMAGDDCVESQRGRPSDAKIPERSDWPLPVEGTTPKGVTDDGEKVRLPEHSACPADVWPRQSPLKIDILRTGGEILGTDSKNASPPV